MKVKVEIYEHATAFYDGADPVHEYTMNHDDEQERRCLGHKCRLAFEAGNFVVTYPVKGK